MFMITALAAYVLLGVTLPLEEDVTSVTSGSSIELAPADGEAWFRILEDEYTCLAVSVSGAGSIEAYDVYGDLLCSDPEGEDVLLSAFRDYWFYVRVTPSDPRGGLVTARVESVPPEALTQDRRLSSRVRRSGMARTFVFSPEESGRWTLVLEGTGGTDLDLEVYGNRMSLWGSSMSLDGSERVTVPALPTDTLTIVVSRYGKGGTGEFGLSAERSGSFPGLRAGSSSHAIETGEVTRFMVPPSDASRLVGVMTGEPGADIDIAIRETSGEYLMGSSSYSALEAVVLPPVSDPVVADLVLYESPDEGPVTFTMELQDIDDILPRPPLSGTVVPGSGELEMVGVTMREEGFCLVSTDFEKSRDGDVLVFRNDGEPVIDFSTERGDEEFLVWGAAGDRILIIPYFYSAGTEGGAEVSITLPDLTPAGGDLTGRVSEDTPAEVFVIPAPRGTIQDIRLFGRDRETDLDMLVSGPGLDLAAEGWFSNVDAAGNEAVAVYSEDGRPYGVTVYMYERSGGGEFDLRVRSIESPPLAVGSGEREMWAVIAGISGYPAAADVLNRASQDAVEVYRFLTDEVGEPADHVILLVDAMATADAFREALDSVLDAAGQEDLVLVFFSGHGFQLEPGSGGGEESDSANETICLYDENIEDDWFASAVSGSPAPVIAVLDACHSGGFVNDLYDGTNTLMLTAAREDLSVSERILTPIFLAGARGNADSDSDGYVSAQELMQYVDDRLQLICPECDAELGPSTYTCPDCGAPLKGENAVPRPEQGMFLEDDPELWPVTD